MDNKEFIKLLNVPTRVDADILDSQLQAAGIISIVKSPGAGDYLNILGYGSALGQDIYVTREDYEMAMEIAKDFKTSDVKIINRKRRIQQIFAGIIVLGYIIGIILSFDF